MAIDTSALLTILQGEPERRSFNEEAIEAAERRAMSAAIFVETSIVCRRRPGWRS